MPPRDSTSRLNSLAPRRIAIIKPSALGDVVQALALLPPLRRRFPDAEIDWVINRDYASLLERHPVLAQVHTFDRRGSWIDFLRLLRKLRAREFDLVLDLQGLLRSAVMTLATRAPVRVGLETAREGAGRAVHCLLPETGWGIPAHRRIVNALASLGIEASPAETGLHLVASARNWAQEVLSPLPRPLMAIHAGAAWETKRWPAEKFAQIARRFEGSIVAVGSRSEASLARPIIDALRSAGRNSALDLTGQTSLPQLAAILQQVDLLLSNDSGPMHLGAAAGTPVVGLFTCTSPVISGPAGSNHRLVSTGVPCAASYCRTCPNRGPSHLACHQELSVDLVWEAVQSAAELYQPRRHSA